ncbi:MAG: polysaccharide deacetylase family protein [Melioribacteraceae bacterium]|nr:polysaccharide deacetylase family protein [Melioribacteraceae bacterium]
MNYIINKIKSFFTIIYSFVAQKTQGAIVLEYHSVNPNSKSFLSITPEAFLKQMLFLRSNNWNIISLLDLVTLIENGNEIPDKTVVITFDDGYKDNLDHAFPILEKYKIPATIFVPSALVGKSMVNREGYSLDLLSWDELSFLCQSNLITIGSHTATHAVLAGLDEDVSEAEISESKKNIEIKLDIECTLFAYPKGKNDENSRLLSKKYYKAAVATVPDRVDKNCDLYTIPRRGVYNYTSFIKFKTLLFR